MVSITFTFYYHIKRGKQIDMAEYQEPNSGSTEGTEKDDALEVTCGKMPKTNRSTGHKIKRSNSIFGSIANRLKGSKKIQGAHKNNIIIGRKLISFYFWIKKE